MEPCNRALHDDVILGLKGMHKSAVSFLETQTALCLVEEGVWLLAVLKM